jgi:hypothetical protein
MQQTRARILPRRHPCRRQDSEPVRAINRSHSQRQARQAQ